MIARPSDPLRWPPERFYWAELPACGWRRTGVAPPGALADLEDEFPNPMNELHAVCCPGPGDHLVICAARTDELAALQGDPSELTPSALPSGLTANIDASSLNLLVGAFEPRQARRLRIRRHAARLALLACISGLIILGAHRRAEVWICSTEVLNKSTAALHAADPLGGRQTLGTHEQVQRLEALVSALEKVRQKTDSDPATTLARICRDWPTTLSSDPPVPQNILIGPDSGSIALTVADDPRPFLAGWRPPEGWRVEEPRLVAVGGTTRITLTLRPSHQGDRP